MTRAGALYPLLLLFISSHGDHDQGCEHLYVTWTAHQYYTEGVYERMPAPLTAALSCGHQPVYRQLTLYHTDYIFLWTEPRVWIVGRHPCDVITGLYSYANQSYPELERGPWAEFDGQYFTFNPNIVVGCIHRPCDVIRTNSGGRFPDIDGLYQRTVAKCYQGYPYYVMYTPGGGNVYLKHVELASGFKGWIFSPDDCFAESSRFRVRIWCQHVLPYSLAPNWERWQYTTEGQATWIKIPELKVTCEQNYPTTRQTSTTRARWSPSWISTSTRTTRTTTPEMKTTTHARQPPPSSYSTTSTAARSSSQKPGVTLNNPPTRISLVWEEGIFKTNATVSTSRIDRSTRPVTIGSSTYHHYTPSRPPKQSTTSSTAESTRSADVILLISTLTVSMVTRIIFNKVLMSV